MSAIIDIPERARKRVLSLRLEVFPEWHIYYCPDCRMPMFRYKGQVVTEIPGGAPFELGIEILCHNKECGRVVRLEGFARREGV